MPCSLPYVCSFSWLLWIYVADWWSTLSHLVSSWGALSHQKCMPWTKPLPKPSNFECPAQSPLTLPSQENVLSTSSVCIGTTLQILPSLVMLGKIAAVLGLIHRSLISSLCFNCYNFLEVIVGNYTPLIETILDTINRSLLASSTVHNRFGGGSQSSPAMLVCEK